MPYAPSADLWFALLGHLTGGFDLAFERAGMTCLWQCEIDPLCRRVLARHWPEVARYEDVRKITGAKLAAVDAVCGGFPCQDLSIAGRRQGLAGERSGLWYEFYRVLQHLRPRWVVIENVPGLLSSGDDLQNILDSLTQIGYAVDVNVLDSQEFGVAQRRRRVFLVCARLDALLQRRTPTSRCISADLVARTLLDIWGAIRPAWSAGLSLLDSERRTGQLTASLQRKIGLFESTQAASASSRLPAALDALLGQCGVEASSWGPSLAGSDVRPGPVSTVKAMCESLSRPPVGGAGRWSISMWLSSVLDDACSRESKSITSTWIDRTTDQGIFTFSLVCLSILAAIVRSLDWRDDCWSVATSASTLLRETIGYARQSSSDLFVEPALRDGWRAYLDAAYRLQDQLERSAGSGYRSQVLFEREGMLRHPSESFETREALAGGPEGGSGCRGRQESTERAAFVARSLNAHHGRSDGESETFIVLPFDTTQITSVDNYSNPQPGDDRDPLAAAAHAPAVAFCERRREGGRKGRTQGLTVRRLTPRECARLQGFPDDWCAFDGEGKPISDWAQYRMLGNAVTVNVLEWIGHRLMALEMVQ